MTRSNRLVNRLILAVVALVLVAGGAYLLQPWLHSWFADLPDLRAPEPTSLGLWWVVGACVLVTALAIAWIATRGRGRTGRMLTIEGSDGALAIDSRVVADLVGDAFAANPDVVSAGASAFRVRGARMLSIRIEARRGADLPTVVNSAETIVAHLDDVLELRIPVLLQVASGLRSSLAKNTRVS